MLTESDSNDLMRACARCVPALTVLLVVNMATRVA